jgi:hypothetical protein
MGIWKANKTIKNGRTTRGRYARVVEAATRDRRIAA